MLSNEILEYIEENLKENITLVELSGRYHYSPRQLYYYLHEITGMPIMAYIRQRRLVNAAQEIAAGRKMYDVAMEYGFETQAGFYKAFLQCIGCTPSEFLNHHKLRQLNQVGTKLLSVKEGLEEMNEINIRRMTLSDVKSLWENIFFGNTPEEVRERVQKNIAEMDAGTSIALVASLDDNIIGTALVKKSPHILSSNRCELFDVVVNPAFQRMGVGTKLCLECFVQAKQMGCDYVLSYCRNNGTEHFDQALGMQECGRIPGGILEPWGDKKVFDELIYYKQL